MISLLNPERMNMYLVFGIFALLTFLIATLSKRGFKRAMIKEHSEAYFEKSWKQQGVRTHYYRIAIAMAAFATMAIVGIFKLIENQL